MSAKTQMRGGPADASQQQVADSEAKRSWKAGEDRREAVAPRTAGCPPGAAWDRRHRQGAARKT